MPLSRLIHNAGSACELCRTAAHTPFVFMHIGYPYYEEMIAVAKHYSNALRRYVLGMDDQSGGGEGFFEEVSGDGCRLTKS